MKQTSAALKGAIILVLAGAVVASAAIQATFYVSPDGSDANSGTRTEPFKTLEKARDAVRAINKTMSGDIEVVLRGGTYPLSKTFSLGSEDGGANGKYVRYRAETGETPLVTGGQPITGWTLHDQGKNIWKVEGVTARFRQLYVNNTKAIRARLPNLGANNAPNFYRLTKVDTSGKALNIATSVGLNWKNLNKVEMHLMIAWADATLRLASTTNMGSYTKVKIQSTEENILFNRPYPMLGIAFSSNPPKQQVYYLENAMEFLDTPGEWYLDETANILYYMPLSGEDMTKAKAVAPMVETLVKVAGTSTSNMVGYLAIQGIVFAHTTYMRPSQMGFLDAQAGQYSISSTLQNKQYVGRPPAGVMVTNAHHVRFERNVLAQMAATGLDFVSGTNNSGIVGNVITDCGINGISIGKFTADSATEFHVPYNPTDKAEISTNDTIRSNLVTNVTTEAQGGVGIVAGYPRYVVIEHNEVSYMGYTGINVGYGWTKTPNAMTNNHINWNNIHHVNQLLADGGNIYTLSNQGTGGQIQYNYMHDSKQSQWADYWILPIYLDEGSSGFDISHNVSVNSPSGVACNVCGSYTQSDNNGTSATTIANAGIEPAYADIKSKVAIPVPQFSSTGEGLARRGKVPTFGVRMVGHELVVDASSSGGRAPGSMTVSVHTQSGRLVAAREVEAGRMLPVVFDLSAQRSGTFLVSRSIDGERASVGLVKLP
ncbi:MAG TPA: right-handed parallel beta-helix repeat-containing protein [Fibrobacteria bacterium]|nr:right-handed parallel beta-helix repeat-containing protein [Fibrobacteria bacterium]HOX51956.1 right-handed parallel beta-helix repeat-containing protein [Fibrobacteria bacterium]